jgi:hypothetical protein
MPEAGAVNNVGTENGTAATRPEGPRSGYARLKSRHRHLIEMHERLQADHAELADAYAQLETAFFELRNLHDDLLNDLERTARPQRPPVRFGQALMGSPYGR